MSINTTPMFTGPEVTVAELEAVFGSIVGAVMGYGEGEFGADGRLRWCAAVLPGNSMQFYLCNRAKEVKATGGNPRQPFLLAMGSLKRAAKYGGVPRALYGVALAYPGNLPAEEILHKEDLQREDFNSDDGKFRWPMGVPFLRVWLSHPPVSFADILSYEPRPFNQSDGTNVIPLDKLDSGLSSKIGSCRLREVILDRPSSIPSNVIKEEKKYREGYLIPRRGRYEKARSKAAVDAALDSNIKKFGEYTCEDEECGYTAANDQWIKIEDRRKMFEVHHRIILAKGVRDTSVNDLVVLCPRCHRREHLKADGPSDME